MALLINGTGYRFLGARLWSIDQWRRCNCWTGLASSSPASRNISMVESNFCRRCPRRCSSPRTPIYVVGSEEQTRQLTAANELVALPRLDQRQRHEALQEVGVAEIMLAPESKLIGQTLREVGFSSRYDLNILAIRHRGEKLTTQLEEQTLDFGDTLLVSGGWG